MNIKKISFIAFIFSVLITGCSKKEPELELPSHSESLAGGVWLSNCNSGTAKGVRFDGTSFNDAEIYFTDGSCTTITYVYERIGTYTITPQADDTTTSKAYYDKIVDDYAMTPATSAAATTFNAASTCGFNDWASGTLKVVTGLNCGNGILNAGTAQYDVYTYVKSFDPLEGQAGDLFFGYFGFGYDGTTPANRPSARYHSFTFRKYELESTSLSESTGSKLLEFYQKNKN